MPDNRSYDSLTPVWKCLKDEVHNRTMGGLLLILVLLLHLWVGLWLMQPAEPVAKINPVMIEVALLAAPVKPTQPAPVQETKAPPPLKKTPEKPKKPKKPQTKTPVKKNMPLVSKPKEPPKPPPITEEMHPMPEFPAFNPSISEQSTKAVTKQDSPLSKAAPNAVPVAGKDERITCIHCPKPEFPAIALRRNWQGSVKLKLQLSADGSIEQATVLASSGHDILDDKAINDVKKWRFVPGKPGRFATQIINFKFDN